MISRNGWRGELSPALDLSNAVPFRGAASAVVASPRKAKGSARVASPRDGAISQAWASPRDGAISQAWASPRDGAISEAWASPRKSASHPARGTKAGKLKLSESGAGRRKSWTIPTGRLSGEALRVRRSDTGFAVTLRYRDQSDELREPYLCYLTASEWGEARQWNINQIVGFLGEKMRRRKDAKGLAELISRLEATAMNESERRNAR